MKDDRIGDVHQNIKAVHPVQTGGICSTCHAANNVELLALKSGERVSLITRTASARSATFSRRNDGPAARTASASTAGRGDAS